MARVLVIDDDDQVRGMMRQMLEREGHEVTDAPDGAVGMRRFRQQPSDLVVTNIFMPERDGLEVIREIRRDFPDIPILAVSGGASLASLRSESATGVLKTAQQFGAARILSKPFEWQAFTEAVGALLAGKE